MDETTRFGRKQQYSLEASALLLKEGRYLREGGWRVKKKLLRNLQLISSVLKSREMGLI